MCTRVSSYKFALIYIPQSIKRRDRDKQKDIYKIKKSLIHSGTQAVALAGEAKKQIEMVLGKMATISHSLLLAVGRLLGGIQIDNQPLLVLPP
jgi:hypothetical protein